MALMIAEYVVRVATELDGEDEISEFLIAAAQTPGQFLVTNLQNAAVKLVRSGTKGAYAYADPILKKASRRRAWKALRPGPDQSNLETAIVSGIAATVGDEEAAAAAAEGRVEEAQPLAEAASEATIDEIAADAGAQAAEIVEAANTEAANDATTQQPAAE